MNQSDIILHDHSKRTDILNHVMYNMLLREMVRVEYEIKQITDKRMMDELRWQLRQIEDDLCLIKNNRR